MRDTSKGIPQNAVSEVVGSIAIAMMRERLAMGESVGIPSLGIEIRSTQRILFSDDDLDCGCHYQEPYGWVIMAGCALHD